MLVCSCFPLSSVVSPFPIFPLPIPPTPKALVLTKTKNKKQPQTAHGHLPADQREQPAARTGCMMTLLPLPHSLTHSPTPTASRRSLVHSFTPTHSPSLSITHLAAPLRPARPSSQPVSQSVSRGWVWWGRRRRFASFRPSLTRSRSTHSNQSMHVRAP